MEELNCKEIALTPGGESFGDTVHEGNSNARSQLNCPCGDEAETSFAQKEIENKSSHQYTEEIDWSAVVKTLLPSRGKSIRSVQNFQRYYDVSSFVTLPRKHRNYLDSRIARRLENCLSGIRCQKKCGLKQRCNSFHEFSVEGLQAQDGQHKSFWNVTECCDPRVLPVPMAKKREYKNRLGHHYLDYNTLKKKIEHQHYEIKEHTSDILNGIKAPFVFWSHDLKRIEGRYGTGVLSFFLFLRWMVYVNLLMTILVISFIVIPETIFHFQEQSLLNNTTSIFYGQTNAECRNEYCNVAYIKGSNYTTKSPADLLSFCSNNYTTSIEQKNAIVNKLQDFLQGTGWMELSAMFIGWYKPTAMRNVGFAPKYDLPIIYMVVTMSYFLLCLILMVFYTRKSIRESVLKRESHLQQYCNMIFSGWDFTIEDRKLADIKHGNILQNLRSHLAEARRLADVSQWSTKKRIKITFMRILINVLVVFIWVGSGFCIYQAILVAEKEQGISGSVALLTEYLPSIVITALNLFLPLLFNFLAKYEQYSLSFTVKITLIRCIFSQLASICVLIGTLHSLIMCEDKTECGNGIGNCKAPLCWETYVGQQIYKLTLLDFAIVFLLTFFVGYPRKVVTDRCKCKLAEFVGKEEFDIPKNVLSLVYSQSLCWLGAFYSPFLPLLSLIKYIVFFYMKKFALFVNCVPAKESYKAARSNTFFMIVSMLSYLIGLFAFVYSIATIMPSKGCGPFRMYDTAWDVVVTFINKLPPQAVATLHFIGSAGFGIPAFIILSLLFYYYLTISATYGEMAEVLKGHLIVEGRDKHFLLKKLLIILRQPEL